MEELLVINSINSPLSNFYSLVGAGVGLLAGAFVMRIAVLTKNQFLARWLTLSMVAAMFIPFLMGTMADTRVNRDEGNPNCQATLQSERGETVTIRYVTSPEKPCFKQGSKVTKITLDGPSLPKGSLYMESGVIGPSIFIK